MNIITCYPYSHLFWWPFLFLLWSNDAHSHQSTFPPPDCFHVSPTSSVRTCITSIWHYTWPSRHTRSWDMYNPARDANEGPPNTPLMPFLLDLCLCLQTATLMIIYRTYHLQYYSAAFTTQEKHWTKIMIFQKRTWERKTPDQLSTGGHTAT